MNTLILKPLFTALALALVAAGCGVESGKSQPVASPKAAVAANPLAILLAYQGGTNVTDLGIRRCQDQIRTGQQTDVALERLGWLFVARARETFDAGFYKLAEQGALALDARQPRCAEPLLLRAHVLQNLHRFAESEAVARELVATRGLAFDYGVLGDSLMEQGKLAEAVEAYQRMADLKPDSQAATRAAHLRWLKGDLAGAIELMELAANAVDLRDSESAAWVFTRLAALRFQQSAPSVRGPLPHPGPLPLGEGESSADSRDAVSRSMVEGQSANGRCPNAVPAPGGEGPGEGGCSHNISEFTEAERNLQTALALRLDYPPALLLRGKMLMAQNKFVEAIEPLRLAEKQNPLPEYQWALADALDAAGLTAEARAVETRLLRSGASADPRSFALFLATRGEQPHQALRLAREELTARADVFTHDAVAWAELARGHDAAAWQSMQRALAEGTQDARLFFHAAVIAARCGKTDDAEKFLQQANALAHLLLPSERKQLCDAQARHSELASLEKFGP